MKIRMKKSWIGLSCYCVVFCFLVPAMKDEWRIKVERAEFLHRSVKQVTDVIVHDIFSPPVAARIYTYMSVAGYEAAIHQDEKYVTLAGQLNGLEPVPQTGGRRGILLSSSPRFRRC